ncbi:unnamed protein product, partial [Symbiodinium necroappetens]
MATGGEAPACSKFSKPAEKAKAKAKTRAKAKAKAKSKSKASAKSKQALVDDEELEAARSEGRGSGTGSDGPDDPDVGNPATDEGKESESEGHDASDNGEALDDACSKPAGKAKGRPKAKATAKSKSKPKAKSKRAQAANGAESSANKEDEGYREAKEAKAKAKRKAKATAKAKPTADEADLEDIDTVESKVKGEVDDDGVSDGQCSGGGAASESGGKDSGPGSGSGSGSDSGGGSSDVDVPLAYTDSDDEFVQQHDSGAGAGAVFLHDGDGVDKIDDEEPSMTTIPAVSEEARDATSIFQYADRCVHRVWQHFGLDGIQNLRNNISGCALLSLYSGLGGAELSCAACWQSVCRFLTTQSCKDERLVNLPPPSPPVNFGACDVEASCQAVLKQHASPPHFIVSDLRKFLNPSVVQQMEALVEAAREKLESIKEKFADPKKSKTGGKRKRQDDDMDEDDLIELGHEIDADQAESASAGADGADEGVPAAAHESSLSYQETVADMGDKLLRDMLCLMETESAWNMKVGCVEKSASGKPAAAAAGTENDDTMSLLLLREMPNLFIFAGSVCKDWSTMNRQRQPFTGRYMVPFGIMLGLVRLLSPRIFFHECTRQFRPSLLAKSLPGFQLIHKVLEPIDFGWPGRRGRSYSALLRTADCIVVRDVESIRKFFSPLRVDCGVFFQASEEEVDALRHQLAAARLKDPSATFEELLPPRPSDEFDEDAMDSASSAREELLLAQGVPVNESSWKAAGFPCEPISFNNVTAAQKRRMAGNTFNQ